MSLVVPVDCDWLSIDRRIVVIYDDNWFDLGCLKKMLSVLPAVDSQGNLDFVCEQRCS